MADVFVEWRSDDRGETCSIAAVAQLGCADLHKVRWRESFLARSGDRLICRFEAPDAESVRLALRRARAEPAAVWSGRVIHGGAAAEADAIVEQAFAAPPANLETALQQLSAARLRPYGLQLVTAVASCDRRRLVCLCRTPPAAEPASPRVLYGDAWLCRRVGA